jgi:hypothetical protein
MRCRRLCRSSSRTESRAFAPVSEPGDRFFGRVAVPRNRKVPAKVSQTLSVASTLHCNKRTLTEQVPHHLIRDQDSWYSSIRRDR